MICQSDGDDVHKKGDEEIEQQTHDLDYPEFSRVRADEINGVPTVRDVFGLT